MPIFELCIRDCIAAKVMTSAGSPWWRWSPNRHAGL